MKILDAGTQVLDDRDVLAYIREKHAQNSTYAANHKNESKATSKRPENFLRALRRHEEHLNHAERPFRDNDRYDADGEYAVKLMQKMSELDKEKQLTKTELLMLINHRPASREMLLPMVEDIESRFSEEEQEWIVEQVVEVLGQPGATAEEDGQAEAGDEGGHKGDVEMAG